MSRLMAAATLLTMLLAASPAPARMAEVTTAVPVDGVETEAALQERLQSAVDDALNDTIAFTPTLVAVTDARVIGDRLYVKILIADEEGEEMLNDLTGRRPHEDEAPAASPRTMSWI